MGALADLWYEFWDAVATVIEAIWQAVQWVFENLVPGILIAIGGVLAVTTVIALFAPAVATAFVSAVTSLVTGIVTLTAEIAVATFEFTVAAVEAFATGFATLLELIDFSALLEIHELLMIVSDDYRALIAQLFDAISEVSESLFGNTFMLHLMFHSTRRLILSASAMIGIPYDIGEVQWLVAFDDILVKFNEKAEEYMESPEQLLYDLDEWAEKNAIDVAGWSRYGDRATLKGTLEFLNSFALDLNTFHRDYEAFKFSVPRDRGRDIGRAIDPINLRLGAFQFNTYERHRLETGYMIKDNKNNLDENRRRLKGIEWGFERPSRGFSKIEDLPEDDRFLEEEIIEDYSSRELGRDNEELVRKHDERIAEEEEKKAPPLKILPPPSWQTITEKEVTRLAMEKSKRRDSPFVGDY